jgi:hypothetical protein
MHSKCVSAESLARWPACPASQAPHAGCQSTPPGTRPASRAQRLRHERTISAGHSAILGVLRAQTTVAPHQLQCWLSCAAAHGLPGWETRCLLCAFNLSHGPSTSCCAPDACKCIKLAGNRHAVRQGIAQRQGHCERGSAPAGLRMWRAIRTAQIQSCASELVLQQLP